VRASKHARGQRARSLSLSYTHSRDFTFGSALLFECFAREARHAQKSLTRLRARALSRARGQTHTKVSVLPNLPCKSAREARHAQKSARFQIYCANHYSADFWNNYSVSHTEIICGLLKKIVETPSEILKTSSKWFYIVKLGSALTFEKFSPGVLRSSWSRKLCNGETFVCMTVE